jgi:hypothetical protein
LASVIGLGPVGENGQLILLRDRERHAVEQPDDADDRRLEFLVVRDRVLAESTQRSRVVPRVAEIPGSRIMSSGRTAE